MIENDPTRKYREQAVRERVAKMRGVDLVDGQMVAITPDLEQTRAMHRLLQKDPTQIKAYNESRGLDTHVKWERKKK